jgi:eukaryotic-like serine/threonine-protein kinase
MVQSLNDFGQVLAEAGRGSEAGKPLDEAQALARELKNNSLQATILNTRGDVLFYGGDAKGAKQMYEQAARAAAHGQSSDVLIAKVNIAKAALTDGHSAPPAVEFGRLAQQADALRMPQLAVECAVYQAQAMLNSKDFAHARLLLDQNLGKSEKLGLRMQTAKIHYLIGTSFRLSGNASDATGQYGQALRQFDEIKKDPGAEHVLERSDLRSMYADATRWTTAKS